MASFTDVLPQFAPYVSQIPNELMLKVGMDKQQKYEQGIQKIQSNIDNVAGLDIANPVQQKYLESKLNALGNDLKWVGAGDFSDFQLVNSVNGMTNQIVKDPNVLNAVSSTSWLRKQQSEMEKAISEGKSSQANQWDFLQKADKYLNSDRIDEKFNGRYTQYTDVNKKWLDVFKTLHPSITEQDMPYVRNNDGSINYNKTAAAMTRISKETVSEQQIQDALRSSLTPDDLNQLSINGRYQFQNASPEQLNQYSTKKYESTVKNYDNYIKHFEGLANMSNADPEVKKKALESIEYYKKAKETAKIDLEENIQLAASNPDEIKSNIYKNGAIEEFAHAYSWENNKLNLLNNPVLEAEHWEKTNALDNARYNLSVRSQLFSEKKGMHDMLMDEKNYNLALNTALLKSTGSQSGAVVYGGKDTKIKDPLVALNKDAVDFNDAADSIVSEYAKSNNVDFVTAQNRFKAYRNGDKTAIDASWKSKADTWKKNTTDSENIIESIKQVENEVNNSPEVKAQAALYSKSINSLPALDYNIEGKKYSFSRKEIENYALKKRMHENPYVALQESAKGVNINLTPKESILESIVSKSEPAKKTLNAYRKVIVNNESFLKKRDASINELLLEKNGSYVPAVYNINVTNKDGATSRDNMEGVAGSILMRFGKTLGGQKGGAETLSPDDVTKGRDWLAGKDKDNLQYKRLTQGKNQFLVMMNGADEIVIPLTPKELPLLPRNANEPSQIESEVLSLQQRFNGTTNPKHIPQRGHFQPENFTNVKNLTVTADLEWDRSDHSMNYINYNIKLPSGWYYMQLENYKASADQAAQFLQSNTDRDIKQLFLDNPKVSQKIKDEILNLK
jgi:hypothetical protein